MANENSKTPIVERRVMACSELEVRDAEGEPPVLVGYAALFDERSEDLGGFVEQIAPGAFSGSVGGDIRALINHNSNHVLGRTKSRTLRVEEDNRGLRIEVTPPDTGAARDLLESVRRGDIDQMSFGFRTKKDSWDEVDGTIVRTLLDVTLIEVSPVTFPAYPQTEIALRSMEAWQEENTPEPPDFTLRRRKLDLLEG
ncbi:HK97 family phage prohead protease [uncultured Roseobacter sp.]|uniref:HK97 family phage prohead protease n=1 Tax=uncultured Roseobacter sp. TaxID=114847 RepID=UPI00262EC2FD|nr:HK97 family phage prohead protease [uncultured Roseobacter sp.]